MFRYLCVYVLVFLYRHIACSSCRCPSLLDTHQLLVAQCHVRGGSACPNTELASMSGALRVWHRCRVHNCEASCGQPVFSAHAACLIAASVAKWNSSGVFLSSDCPEAVPAGRVRRIRSKRQRIHSCAHLPRVRECHRRVACSWLQGDGSSETCLLRPLGPVGIRRRSPLVRRRRAARMAGIRRFAWRHRDRRVNCISIP